MSIVVQLQTLGDEQWVSERRMGAEDPGGGSFLAPSVSARIGGKWAAIWMRVPIRDHPAETS